MTDFRLAIYMAFALALLAIALVAFGDAAAASTGQGILYGLGFGTFITLLWKGLTM